ncbi:MAG: putative competence-damage inducible protein [Acidimicrobiales bacterium]|nr:putative competence-damage inducible protein [Acidimicrobiales bacterium]
MRCEVVAVGTELLLGQVVDTNSAWIGEQLALAGIDSHFQTKVGDNFERMVECLGLAVSRSDAVIVCGGLGPTQDDITREVLAAVMGVELVRSAEMEERIRSLFGSRGRSMPESNLRQADCPAGASFLPVMPGTAPGIRAVLDGSLVYLVPGVPWEMEEMMRQAVLPDLRAHAGVSSVIRSRVLRTWGQSESGLAEMLADRIHALDEAGNPTLAFLASGIEGLKVRVTAKASDEAEAEQMLRSEAVRLEELLGPLVFGADEDTMESVVLGLLARRGTTLAVAESMTGGMIADRLVAVPGASRVFRGGVVSYAGEVKHEVLGVPPGPVVTEEAARAMAVGVRALLRSDASVAVTGVAGPDEQEGRPPGTTCMAVALGEEVTSLDIQLPGGRQQVREFATISVLNMLRLRLLGDEGSG